MISSEDNLLIFCFLDEKGNLRVQCGMKVYYKYDAICEASLQVFDSRKWNLFAVPILFFELWETFS